VSLSIAALKKQAIELGIDAIDAEVLLSFVIKKDRSYLFAWPENQLTPVQLQLYQALVQRRQDGEPIAYLVGEREFWSMNLLTNSSTLIPRADTEVLVETVLQIVDEQPRICFDLGTGTGAIALALKSERPTWTVQGVDRIAESVALANKNAQRHNLSVQFSMGSWCDSIESEVVDVLVSNPPYIDKDDPHLDQGDVRFEPASALVADDQGLADIEVIAKDGMRCLKGNGALFLEHGWTQADAVQSILAKHGYQDVQTVKDYTGNDRVTFGFKRR
jgi:release factor glutamine methyltransferase